MHSHGVVIGGSMAGLLAARVLSKHFASVTLVERDSLPDVPEGRSGVPQARHFHTLLVQGYRLLENMFPGLDRELEMAGALPVDPTLDVAWFTPAGWGVRFPSNLRTLSCTRNLLEWAVRRRVRALPTVRILEGYAVDGLSGSPDRTAVTGVTLTRREAHGTASAPERISLAADLVVDASGRGSRTPQWLETLGFDRPAETVVNGRLGYVSRMYCLPAGYRAGWKLLYCQLAPPRRSRGAVAAQMEENGWILTLIGGGGDYPPSAETGFLDFAESLPMPALHELIRLSRPAGPITAHRATENRLRHYERLSRFPEGLAVLGDAACAFNPVYGQGMTTAALGARTLDAVLTARNGKNGGEPLTGVGTEFQQALARCNELPWLLATGEDYRFPGVAGCSPGRTTALMHRYLDGLTYLSTRDPLVRRALLDVIFLLAPAGTLFRPELLLRFLTRALRMPELSETEAAAHIPEPVSLNPYRTQPGATHSSNTSNTTHPPAHPNA